MSHLTDDTLNEYIDNALAPASRAEVDAHLAVCATCSAELDVLRALFAQIESLPEVALQRDLAPAVVGRLPIRAQMPRPVRWVLVAQGVAALVILAALLPLLDFSALQLPTLSPNWFILPALPTFSDLLARNSLTLPSLSLPIDLPALSLVLLLVSAGLLWLIGNGLLLLLPRTTSLKRRSL